MNRESSLIKNTFILSIGKFLPKLFSVITLPILTAELSKANYGTWDLIGTLVSVLLPIVTIQIQSAAFRFLIDSRRDERKSAEIISSIYFFSLPITLIASLIISIALQDIETPVRVIVCIYFCADILNVITAQVIRGLGYNKAYSVSSIISSLINVILIITTVKILSFELFGVVFSGAIALLGSTIYLFISKRLRKYIRLKSFSRRILIKLLAFSWPMIPNNLSNWVLNLSDRLVITFFWGIEANAVYAVANKIPSLLSIAHSVFVMAWQENASIVVNDKDADEYYSKMSDKIFMIIISITALMISFTPIMFKLLIKGDYDSAYNQIPILFLGMFFYCMSAFQGGIYIAYKKTKSVGVTTMAAAGINLLIDICFVRLIGITAGSISTLIAYLCLYIFRSCDILKFQKINYNVKKQIGLLIIISGMLVLCLIHTLWCDIINMILGIVLFYILNKDLIRKMFEADKNYLIKHKKQKNL